jgi:hypothetical protein
LGRKLLGGRKTACRLQVAFEALRHGGAEPGLPQFAGRAVAADRLTRRLKATWHAVQVITKF